VRREVCRAMLLAVVLAAAPAAAAEQNAAGAGRAEWCAFPAGGVLFTRGEDAAAPQFGNYTFGTSFTWNLNSWFGLESEAGFGIGGHETVDFKSQRLAAQAMPDTIVYSGNVVFNPAGSARAVVPYVIGGAGALQVIGREGTETVGVVDRHTLPTGDVGGGAKWYAARGWGVRGDYRLLVIGRDDQAPAFLGGEATRYAHRVYAGVFATF
jgi:outer membrane protein with beta-barrel domain